MKLKISGKNKELFKENLNSFLNVATMICLRGHIPTQYDIDNADRLGRWWYREDSGGCDRYQLFGLANNDWLNVKEEGENFIIAEFNFRYDGERKKKESITNLMLAFFDFVETVE